MTLTYGRSDADVRQQVITEEREALRAEIVRVVMHTVSGHGGMRELRADIAATCLKWVAGDLP